MENIEFKELGIIDINENVLDHYNRYQEIKKCYRKEEGNWVIKNIGIKYSMENKAKNTSHNRSACVSPPYGSCGSTKYQSG